MSAQNQKIFTASKYWLLFLSLILSLVLIKSSQAAGITVAPELANANTSTDYCLGWNVGAGGYAAGDYIEYEFDPAFNLDNLEIYGSDPGTLSGNELSLFVGNQTCNAGGTERIAYGVYNSEISPDIGFTDVATSMEAVVYDNVNGYAYMGTGDWPAKIIKVKISDFSYVDTLMLPPNQNGIMTGVVDTTNGYAYFDVISDSHAGVISIIKVKLSDFSVEDTLPISGGRPSSSVIDIDNGYAYFATDGSNVVKIDLSDFSQADTLSLGTEYLFAATIDTVNGYAYFGTGYADNKIYKVKLSDFSSDGVLSITDTADNDINSFTGATIDIGNHYAYFSSDYNSPGQIIRIDLSDFSYDHDVDLLTLNLGEDGPYGATIDTANGFAYFGLGTSPAMVVRIKLSDFSVDAVASANIDEEWFYRSFIDTVNHYVYFPLSTPARVVRFDLDTFSRDSVLNLPKARKAYFVLGTPVAADSDVSMKFTEKNSNSSVITPLSAGSYPITLNVGDSTNYSVDYTDSTNLEINGPAHLPPVITITPLQADPSDPAPVNVDYCLGWDSAGLANTDNLVIGFEARTNVNENFDLSGLTYEEVSLYTGTKTCSGGTERATENTGTNQDNDHDQFSYLGVSNGFDVMNINLDSLSGGNPFVIADSTQISVKFHNVAGNSVKTPVTPGNYMVKVQQEVDGSNPKIIDWMDTQLLYIGNQNKVNITATLDPSISLLISNNDCASGLGILSQELIQACGFQTTVTTNIGLGYTGYIEQNHPFQTTVNGVTTSITGPVDDLINGLDDPDLLSGTYGEYGFGVKTDDITTFPEFTGDCPDYDEDTGYSSLPATSLAGNNTRYAFATHDAAVNGVNHGLTYFCAGVRIKYTTPPGQYDQTLTITVAGNF